LQVKITKEIPGMMMTMTIRIMTMMMMMEGIEMAGKEEVETVMTIMMMMTMIMIIGLMEPAGAEGVPREM
jgi:hypothetical protein